MARNVFVVGVAGLVGAGLAYAASGRAVPRDEVVGSALTLTSVRATVAPGDSVDVEVLVSDVDDLRVYQLQLQALEGERGGLVLEGMTVDKARADFVFGRDFVIDAVDMIGLRVGALRFDGGVKVEQAQYLATFHFRATADAKGTFRINVLEGEESFLADSSSQKIDYGAPLDLEVTVVGGKTPARIRDQRAPR